MTVVGLHPEELFDKLSDGKDREFIKVDAKYYEPVVELIKFIDQLRKQKS